MLISGDRFKRQENGDLVQINEDSDDANKSTFRHTLNLEPMGIELSDFKVAYTHDIHEVDWASIDEHYEYNMRMEKMQSQVKSTDSTPNLVITGTGGKLTDSQLAPLVKVDGEDDIYEVQEKFYDFCQVWIKKGEGLLQGILRTVPYNEPKIHTPQRQSA